MITKTEFKIALTFLLLLVGATFNVKAQEEKKENFLIANILHQDELRKEKQYYAGIGIVSLKIGYQLTSKIAIDFTAHPKNNFSQGDPIGLGFGTGTGKGNWQQANVYGQTNLSGYENMDAATFLLGGRYFIFSSLFISGGFVAQIGSWRQVDFANTERTIGSTTYNNLEFSARTELNNQYAPYFGMGVHHQIGAFGFFVEGSISPLSKKVDQLKLTSSESISAEDKTSLERTIKNEAESESFGILTYGISFHF